MVLYKTNTFCEIFQTQAKNVVVKLATAVRYASSVKAYAVGNSFVHFSPKLSAVQTIPFIANGVCPRWCLSFTKPESGRGSTCKGVLGNLSQQHRSKDRRGHEKKYKHY